MAIKRVARKTWLGKPKAQQSVAESVNRQCAKLMGRLKQTVPLPWRPDEIVFELLPPHIRQFFVARQLREHPFEMENLRLSLMWGKTVHVAIEKENAWKAMMEGTAPFHRVFWMELPFEVPMPDAMTRPYRLFETHPKYDSICEWFDKASRFNSQIEEELEQLGYVMQYIDSAAVLRHIWPTILKFVKLQGPTVMHIPKEVLQNVRRQARDVLDNAALVHSIEAHLAAATLLPEDFELNAWVSFKTI